MFVEIPSSGTFLNLHQIAEIDTSSNEVTMADGSTWHFNNEDMDVILKAAKKLCHKNK